MKRYIRTSYNVSGDAELLAYIPKRFKKYVTDIRRGEPEWNDVTQRFGSPIEVTWLVNGDTFETSYSNAGWMRESLKSGGDDDLCRFFIDHGIEL